LEAFAKGQFSKGPIPPVIPSIQSISDFWSEYLDALTVIKQFTDRIKEDLKVQQNLFREFRVAETALSLM
jgi:hypothetical protein